MSAPEMESPSQTEQPQQKDVAREEIANMGAVLCLRECMGENMPATTLVEWTRQFDWAQTFFKLSWLAGSIANGKGGALGPEINSLTRDLLERGVNSVDPSERRIAEYVRGNPGRPIATESSIYLMQALAILDGSENGKTPSDGILAYLLLAANDYAFDWTEESEEEDSPIAALAAELERARLFNHQADPLRELVRAFCIFNAAPHPEPILGVQSEWDAFQYQIFGTRFYDYFAKHLAPLFLTSQLWGTNRDEISRPILNEKTFLSKTDIATDGISKLFAEISATRQEARLMIARSRNGLPLSPTIFYRKPLIRMPTGELCASSPWAVREIVRGGLWNRHRVAIQIRYPKENEKWLQLFGYQFENWCRQTATYAKASARSAAGEEIILPGFAGSNDEIDDIVIASQNAVILFSAKASAVREPLLRGAKSRKELVDWYERFLFVKREGNRRGGAFLQLDAKVQKIRAGAFPILARNAKIYPAIISYDAIGDNAGFYRWAEERCLTDNLLCQENVAPPTFLSIADFEMLMALQAKGKATTSFMETKTSEKWRYASINRLLYEISPDGARLPEMEAQFKIIKDSLLAGFKGGRADLLPNPH